MIKNHFVSSAVVALFALVTLSACDTSVGDETVDLSFQLQSVVGSTPLVAGTQTYSINGRNTTIESARFYMSDIVLLRSDGSEVALVTDDPVTTVARDSEGNDVPHTVTEEVILAKSDIADDVYHIGEVEAGDYVGIRFSVGLSGLTNKIDASQMDATHVLATQTDKGNHWSWNSGYIFLRMDGQVDTDGDDTVDSEWHVHLGTPNFLETVTLDTPFTLNAGDEANLHLVVDYAKFLTGLDYSDPDQLLCHTMDNLPVAQVVGANIPSAFSFHGVHN